MKGIEFFHAIEKLTCYNVRYLTELDMSQNTELNYLYCDFDVSLSSLNVSENTKLETLSCLRTALTELDVSHNPALKTLICSECKSLTELDVSKNPELQVLGAYQTGLTELDVSHNPALKILECEDTGITVLDISHCPLLVEAVEKGKHSVNHGDLWVYYVDGDEHHVYVPENITLILYHKPVITAQPKSVKAAAGETVSFTVTADSAKSWQWYYRKTPTGAWNKCTDGAEATLTVTAKSYRNGFQYRCKVTNKAGSVYTSAATLSVKPGITTQPKSVTVSAGATTRFTVKAEGATSYQWYYRKTPTGAWNKCTDGTSATLNVEAKTYRSGYQYRCKVSNDAGSVYTNAATLRVKPGVTAQPASQTATVGTTVSFTVKAAGATSYQWYYRKTPTGAWNKCTDGTSATLNVEVKSYRSGYQYRCKVSNDAGYEYSSTATLTVK